jgi:aldose 1-epimerase
MRAQTIWKHAAAAAAAVTLALAVTAQAQSVTSRRFGQLADGRAVHEFLLDSGTGLKVRLLDYGGIVRSVEVPDRNGRVANVALALDSLAAHEKRPNFSALIGRYANRLSGGGVTIDGVFHKLAANPRASSPMAARTASAGSYGMPRSSPFRAVPRCGCGW